MQTLKMSETPEFDLMAARNVDNPQLPVFRPGYEYAINQMPDFEQLKGFYGVDFLKSYASEVMNQLATDLMLSDWPISQVATLQPNELQRIFLGVSNQRSEIIVGLWGEGFVAPPHGHGTGFLEDRLLAGKMEHSTYRLVDKSSKTVRLTETKIVHPGNIMLQPQYAQNKGNESDRIHGIHGFTVLKNSASLHFVPEHPRDGRDDVFNAEYFEQVYGLNYYDVVFIRPEEILTSIHVGDVILTNRQFGLDMDAHYTIITDKPIMGNHGLRHLVGHTIVAPKTSIFNAFQSEPAILKLIPKVQKDFLSFHAIDIYNGFERLTQK